MNSHKSKSIYLFFFLSFIGYSQGDQRARALLDQVSEVYASYDTMQMRFSYQLDNTSEGISQKEEGEILVSKANSLFCWTKMRACVWTNVFLEKYDSPNRKGDFSVQTCEQFFGESSGTRSRPFKNWQNPYSRADLGIMARICILKIRRGLGFGSNRLS